MAKKTNFGPAFCPFGQNLGPQIFFRGFYLDQMFDIVASCTCMQFQRESMIQTQSHGKKKPLILGIIQAHQALIRAANYFYFLIYFFQKSGFAVTRYRNPIQYSPQIVGNETKVRISKRWLQENKIPIFTKNEHFSPLDTHTPRGKKCKLFGKFCARTKWMIPYSGA